jgi:hypothetical protein
VNLDRLRSLVLMLSSEHDAEALNAVRAIGRQLKLAGKDWHWLAGRLLDREAPLPGAVQQASPNPPQGQEASPLESYRGKSYQEWVMKDLIQELWSWDDERFIKNLRIHFKRHGPRALLRLSTKAQLRRLIDEFIGKT